ncbi:MAG: hypothetical protein EOP11_16855 [Proteobacteria bacterium]|nr:MAG: hypothetical protein EOP11_16855 [Pseudomonadota bacterium]
MTEPLTPSPLATDFVPREGLQRTIKYRNVLRLSYYGLIIIALASMLIGFIYTGLTISESALLDPRILLSFLVVLPSVAIVIARWRLRPYAFTAVHVHPAGFTRVRPWDSTEVSFSAIKSLQVWHLPYFGGRFLLTEENGTKHEFTAALERCEYLLDALVRARPELMDHSALVPFRRTLVTSDHSWARLSDRMRIRGRELLALYVLAPLLGLGIAWPLLNQGPVGFADTFVALLGMGAAIFLLNLTVGLFTGSIGEGYLIFRGTRALRANPNEMRRDPALEARVSRLVVWSHAALFAVILAAMILGLV